MAQGELFSDGAASATNSPPAARPAGGPRHSWFFALRPSPADAARIHALAGTLLVAHGVHARRIDPERLHITLEFIGYDVGADVLELACRAADTIGLQDVEACFDAIMMFHPSNAVVLTGNQGLDGVRALRRDLGCAMADLGFAPPADYRLHMTLCYDARVRLPRTPVEPLGFRATEFALVKSHVGLSRHEVVRTWPLAG